MNLSIIIVNYRGWRPLADCLNAIEGINKTFSCEVIVVDNHSADGRFEAFKASYPEFVFIENPVNGGFANGCNLGAKYAQGEFLLFLNPDTVADVTNLVALYQRAKENQQCYIVSCKQVEKGGKESKAYGIFPALGTLTGVGRFFYRILYKRRLEEKLHTTGMSFHPEWVSGSVMMIQKDVFNAIGRFDEDYWMYFEDVDICKRARNAGGNIVYYNDLTIQHNHGGSSRINIKTTALTKTEVIVSNHIYLSKHFSGFKKLFLQLLLILNKTLSLFLSAIVGLLFFFVPKMYAKVFVFFGLMRYYVSVIVNGTWLSRLSVNFKSR